MEWISIKDELPDKSERVLCFFNDGKHTLFEIGAVINEKGKQFKAITHWMRPEPPEEP